MTEPAPADLATAVAAFARAWGVPGGVVAVTDAHGTLWTQPFGVADLERGTPATDAHLFEIGSISKISTASAVLQLVDAGRIALDTPVARVLPWLPAGLGAPGVTIELLLQHAAGIPASIDAHQDDLAQLASANPPLPVPGVQFHYSNVGFMILGAVVAQCTGRSLRDVVTERVLSPAGMASSIAAVTADDRERLAVGYRPARPERQWIPGEALERAPFLEVAGADGNIAATAPDLAAFGRLLLGRAAGVLSPERFADMAARVGPGGEPVLTIAGVPPTASSRYGLGVNVEQVAGHTVLTHGGGMVGYASFLHVDLDAGRAVAVVTNANGDSPVAEAIARCVAAGAASALDALRPDRWETAPDDAPLTDLQRAQVPRVIDPAALGRFGALEVRTVPRAGGGVGLEATLDGVSGPLLWSWGDRVLSPHPALHTFGLWFDGEAWISGTRVYRREPAEARRDPASVALGAADDDLLAPYTGRYRAYTPWFPEFRVLVRDGALRFVSPGGVESPGEDLPLLPAGDGTFVIGADPRLPERIAFGPIIEGHSAWIDRDGCRYSRAFTS